MIAAGVVGIAYHFPDLQTQPQWEAALIVAIRLLAIINGIFLLKGGHWARWMVIAWMAYHVVLSAFHSVAEVVMHSLLLIAFAYFLFRRGTDDYFQRR
jgi:hypothetical protein